MRSSHYSDIIRLGLPILVGQVGHIVVGFADNAMVGHYSTDALAAASFVNNVFNIAILMAMGFTFGLTPLIGAAYGRGDYDSIGCTLRRGVKLNVCFSLILTAIMGIIYVNVDRLGQPEHLLPLIRPYFLTYLCGILPIAIFQVFAQSAYAINSTKMPMWIMLGANAVNVCGNYALIYGHFGMPELGLLGAGLSTMAARIICPIAIIVIFMTGRRYKPYRSGLLGRVRGGTSWRRLFTTSLPVAVQMGVETASFSIAAVMAGWMGHIELAAYQIIVIVGTLGFTIYYGVGAAVSVLVANASADHQTQRRVAFAGYHIMLCLVAFSSMLFILFGRPMIHIFTNDTAVTATTLTLIVPLVLYQLGDATQITFANALRGTSRVMPMVWIAVLSYIVVGIPATYIMGFILGMGIRGIIFSFSVSLFLAGALFLTTFLRTLAAKNRENA